MGKRHIHLNVSVPPVPRVPVPLRFRHQASSLISQGFMWSRSPTDGPSPDSSSAWRRHDHDPSGDASSSSVVVDGTTRRPPGCLVPGRVSSSARDPAARRYACLPHKCF